MSNYLSRLAARTLGHADIKPRFDPFLDLDQFSTSQTSAFEITNTQAPNPGSTENRKLKASKLELNAEANAEISDELGDASIRQQHDSARVPSERATKVNSENETVIQTVHSRVLSPGKFPIPEKGMQFEPQVPRRVSDSQTKSAGKPESTSPVREGNGKMKTSTFESQSPAPPSQVAQHSHLSYLANTRQDDAPTSDLPTLPSTAPPLTQPITSLRHLIAAVVNSGDKRGAERETTEFSKQSRRFQQPLSIHKKPEVIRAEQSAGSSAASKPQPETEKTIQITIGKVEIRAIPAAPPVRLVSTPARSQPALENYLRKRAKGKCE